MIVYQAIRTLITRAAASTGLDPARISFTAALHAIGRTMDAARDQLPATLHAAETEMLASLVPEREGRICARAVKRIPFAPWPARKRDQVPVSRHATRTATITPPGTTTRTSHGQHKQPATTETQPP